MGGAVSKWPSAPTAPPPVPDRVSPEGTRGREHRWCTSDGWSLSPGSRIFPHTKKQRSGPLGVCESLSCVRLCHPMDCSPPGSSVHGDFSRQEYWSGLPVPSPGDLPDAGIEPTSPTSPTAGMFSITELPGETRKHVELFQALVQKI